MSVFSLSCFGQLRSSRLKNVGQTDVYVYGSRLREKILAAAGPDLVSIRCGKVVLVLDKDTGEAVNTACNTESNMLQPSKAQITVPMSKSVPREIQRKT